MKFSVGRGFVCRVADVVVIGSCVDQIEFPVGRKEAVSIDVAVTGQLTRQ